MNLTQTKGIIAVVLSKRNLLTLLSKVDDPHSQKMLFKHLPTRDGVVRLEVSAEPDETHYASQPYGDVHPVAESFIQNYQEPTL